MIPLILGIYAFCLATFCLLSFFALYQLFHFGYVGDASRRIIVLYLIVSVAVIVTSVVAFILLG